jgi:hypothetical protein
VFAPRRCCSSPRDSRWLLDRPAVTVGRPGRLPETRRCPSRVRPRNCQAWLPSMPRSRRSTGSCAPIGAARPDARRFRRITGSITPEIVRPFYRAVTTIDALALAKRPPTETVRRAVRILCEGGDGGNRTHVRGRVIGGVYERSRRSGSRSRLATPAGLSRASSVVVLGSAGAGLTERAC